MTTRAICVFDAVRPRAINLRDSRDNKGIVRERLAFGGLQQCPPAANGDARVGLDSHAPRDTTRDDGDARSHACHSGRAAHRGGSATIYGLGPPKDDGVPGKTVYAVASGLRRTDATGIALKLARVFPPFIRLSFAFSPFRSCLSGATTRTIYRHGGYAAEGRRGRRGGRKKRREKIKRRERRWEKRGRGRCNLNRG